MEDATGADAFLIRFFSTDGRIRADWRHIRHARFCIQGTGDNGKSVFFNALSGIWAKYATTAAIDTFTASHNDRYPTDLAMLKSARLASASETEDGCAWAEAKIKQMTCGDPFTARFICQDLFRASRTLSIGPAVLSYTL